jgi:hypothetical protein
MIEPTTLAYLAGYIDGDGYISITQSKRSKKVYFGAQVGLAGTRREPHDLAASIWGGKVSMYVPKNAAYRPQFQWSRVGRVAAEVIQAVYPYLLVKQRQAEVALELAEHVEFARGDNPFPWFVPDYDPTEAMYHMREVMIGLNQSRKRVGTKASGRLLDGQVWDASPEAICVP